MKTKLSQPLIKFKPDSYIISTKLSDKANGSRSFMKKIDKNDHLLNPLSLEIGKTFDR